MTTLTTVDRLLYAASLKTYLREYADAAALLTEAMTLDPADPRLYRQRGHRFMTLREYGKAEADLLRAAELADGAPDEHEFFRPEVEQDLVNMLLDRLDDVTEQHMPVNETTIARTAGLYKSNLHFSIRYHLGVTRFLIGNYAGVPEPMNRAMRAAIDDSSRMAVADWTYLTLRRDGQDEQAAAALERAAVGPSVEADYIHYDWRLRLYRGEISPDDLLGRATDPVSVATHGYAVGNWYLNQGRAHDARLGFEHVLAYGDHDAFGYMAAEADLARWGSLVPTLLARNPAAPPGPAAR